MLVRIWRHAALSLAILATLSIGQRSNANETEARFSFTIPPFLSAIIAAFKGDGLQQALLGSLGGAAGIDQEFDYIVVGGGTGGNTIGERLAEAGFRVAIIEAGEFHELSKPLLSTIPGLDIFFIGSSKLETYLPADWGFVTEPQAGANGRRIRFAQGKCIGGSSAVNVMLYHRGPSSMYDQWAEAVGDDSYTLDQFNQFYKRSATFTPPNQSLRGVVDHYHADDFLSSQEGGPIQVGYSNFVSPWATALANGLASLGLKRTDGFNRGGLFGYHYSQTTIRSKDATRSTSAEYIYKAINNGLSNLKIFTNTDAMKVTFDENKRANGVDVSTFGVKYHIKARSEVIVSAGAFKSPQLLMLSGIGPPETLDRFQIPVVSALRGVGQNMWDHVFFGPSFALSVSTLDTLIWNPVYLASAIASYLLSHGGIFSSNAVELLGWEKLPEKYRSAFNDGTLQSLHQFGDDWPEVEYIAINGFVGNFDHPVLSQPLNGKNYASLLGALVAPLSRGNVTLRSASVFDHPVINPNWLTDQADQEVAVAWMKRMREVFKTPQLAKILRGKEYFPGEEVETDKQILDYVRKTLMTVWHPSCTNKMGKKEDPMAVVDSRARVFGVDRLRVVDASAFPLLLPGHPSGTVYALAEKIAHDIIRERQGS